MQICLGDKLVKKHISILRFCSVFDGIQPYPAYYGTSGVDNPPVIAKDATVFWRNTTVACFGCQNSFAATVRNKTEINSHFHVPRLMKCHKLFELCYFGWFRFMGIIRYNDRFKNHYRNPFVRRNHKKVEVGR